MLEARKHVVLVESPTDAAALRRLAATLGGDLEASAVRPRFSNLFAAASPLRIEGRLLDIHAEAACFGSPVFVYSVALSGATAPVTPAGTVTRHRSPSRRPGAAPW